MNRSRNSCRLGTLIVLLASVAAAPSAFAQYAPGGPKFRGSVKSAEGKPLEGVTVSVRGEGKTFVTSVFTNQQGIYVFPPLEQGIKFSLWAQAQGFQTARLNVDAASGEIQTLAGLQLQPLANFEKQLTGVEWMNSFPENTPAEKREKRIYAANCSGCHANQFTLQNRFDAESWSKIVSVMSLNSNGTPMRPNAAGTPTINAYKDTHTHQVTQYAMPHKYSYPYGLAVDNQHNVWINLNNADMLAKFDPATETFTEYQMPSRGTVMRHVTINNNVSPPEIIAAETGLNKVARIQFRKASDME
jgi:hypothetical protein